MLRCIAFGLLLLSPAEVLFAQTLEGRIVNSTGEALAGVYVTLSEDGEARPVATLTNREGWFRLTAPSGGSFIARFEMLGYETVELNIALGSGERRVIEVVTEPRALAVEGLLVRSAGECGRRGVSATQAIQVWEELEKAFRAAAWSENAGIISYRMEKWVRTLDPKELRIVDEDRERRVERYAGAAFATPSPEELMERGFIHGEVGDEVILFHAPDAAILLSDAFEDAHCFSFNGAKLPDTLGIRFEAKDPRKGLVGTVWTRATDFAPLSIEYTYPRLPWPVAASEEQVGGRIEFSQLPEGQWIVTRWWVRTPVIEQESFPSALRATTDSRLRIAEIREEGAEVLEVTAASERLVIELAVIGGRVIYDDGEPAADATIGLAGTHVRTQSDALGRFSLRGVPAGRYDLVVSTPEYEEQELAPHTSPLEVGAGTNEVLAIAVPTAYDRLAQQCMTTGRTGDGRGAIVVGSVVGEVPTQARAEWSSRGDIPGQESETKGGTDIDPSGSFLLCDLPAGRSVQLSLVVDATTIDSTTLDLRAAGIGQVQLVARDVPYAEALIVTVRDPRNQPLEGARVAIASAQRSSVTDALGRATFLRVDVGRLEVAVDHLAYIPRRDTIEVSARSTTIVEVPLANRVFELDEIAVTVVNPSEARNRRRGSSASLSISAADIERAVAEGAANDIGDVLRSMVGSGVRVRPWVSDSGRLGLCVESNRTVVTPGTMGGGCRMVQVVLDGGRLGPEEGAAVLTTLSLGEVRSIELLSPADATFRFGTGNQWGALLIRTR